MKTLRKYTVITRVSLSSAIAYRVTIFARFLFYALFVYVFMMLWKSIYQEGSVQGYTYAQMVWYLAFTEFVGFSCNTNIFTVMNEDVKSGAISYLLGRPTHYVLYQFASALGQIIVNIISFGALAAVFGLIFVGPLPGFRFATLGPVALSVALSIVLNFFFMMLIGLSAFIMEDNIAFFLMYQKINFMLGLFLPVEFLPSWLQPVARHLPFSYIYWAPAKLFVDFSSDLFWTLFARQAMWAAFFVVLVFVFYRLGVRRLQSNGG